MLNSFKLPLRFDPEPLARDLEIIKPGDWTPHFNTGYYEGDWSGVALRSVGGAESQLYPDPSAEFEDTALLAACPNIKSAIAAFKCPLESVRLLRLGAGSRIKEHTDLNLSLDDGTLRVHIPLATNERVDFYVDNEKLVMNPGEAWYINFNLPHRVDNRGETDRIHLVLDCKVNDWLSAMIPAEAGFERGAQADSIELSEETRADFERFRGFVLEDDTLLDRLRQVSNKKFFIALALEMGRELGCNFTYAEVEAALKEERRRWLERWI